MATSCRSLGDHRRPVWEVTGALPARAPARLATCDALPAEATPDVIARVDQMSAGTVDRRVGRSVGGARPKPGTPAQAADLFPHARGMGAADPGSWRWILWRIAGASGAGDVLLTLGAVDVATGWISLEGVVNRGGLAGLGSSPRELREDSTIHW
jgi:hypothetical protein